MALYFLNRLGNVKKNNANHDLKKLEVINP